MRKKNIVIILLIITNLLSAFFAYNYYSKYDGLSTVAYNHCISSFQYCIRNLSYYINEKSLKHYDYGTNVTISKCYSEFNISVDYINLFYTEDQSGIDSFGISSVYQSYFEEISNAYAQKSFDDKEIKIYNSFLHDIKLIYGAISKSRVLSEQKKIYDKIYKKLILVQKIMHTNT